MASIDWIGNAIDVADICTITVTGTWATNDTATLTINSKSLVVTLGTPVTVTDVAALIVAAVNSGTRINATTGSSNVGGQTIPEFAELIASNVAGVITLTTRNAASAGKPFQAYLTRSESTAGDGALGAVTSVQAATGKNWWSNANNWSGGSVPANDDTVNFRDCSVDCLYGLPNASKEVTINIYNSFTGRLGLPKVNRDNQSLPYSEYRQRYVVLDDAGAGSTASHVIGIGDGAGPSLVNIRHNTLTTTFEVECNGKPSSQIEGGRVVNIIAPAGGTLKARKGSIDISDQNGGTAKWTSITVSTQSGRVSDVDILSLGNSSTAALVNMVGGTLYLDWATWSTNGLTLIGAKCTVDTCGIPSAVISDGTLADMGNGTIATLTLNRGGKLDVSSGAGTITITNANYHNGCQVVNPGNRITHTNPVQTYGPLKEVAANLDYGYNRTLQIAG